MYLLIKMRWYEELEGEKKGIKIGSSYCSHFSGNFCVGVDVVHQLPFAQRLFAKLW